MVSTRRSLSRAVETPPPPPPSTKTDTEPALVQLADRTEDMTATLSSSKVNIIETPSGQVKVRPYRSSSNAQLKAVLSFHPRVSSLDRHNTKSQTDEFRGFFVLFWIGLGLLFIRTSLHSWETNRTPLSWEFGRLITGDVLVLALADLLMVLGQFFCVPFVKGLIARGYKYYWAGLVIQHTYQTLYLGIAIWIGVHRQWYWVQAGFLVLHCLSNLMKMHSYMAHNGMLATVFFRLKQEKKELESALSIAPEGRQAVLEEATSRRALYAEGNTPVGTPMGTPGLPIGNTSQTVNFSTTTSAVDGATGYHEPVDAIKKGINRNGDGYTTPKNTSPDRSAGLRRRSILKSANGNGDSNGNSSGAEKKKRGTGMPQPDPDLPHGTSLEPSHNTMPHEPREPNVLSYSSDEKIAVLARNIDMMEDELRSNGAQGLVWPQNVTYRNYFDYMFFPTLVYQLEYPRTDTRRPLVVLEKIAATFGTFSLIYTITEHYIMPYTPQPGESLLISFFNLALPMMVNYLLIFYIIFECVCTGFAELSYFADREFYQDWWNSTSWDQFSRKWNKPVHTFLLRHVYASTMDGLQLSRTSATFVTFLLSACCHELVMAVVSKKIRPYLFLMQMVQLPMIAVGRMPIMKRNKTVGNLFFWIGLMMGFPFLAVCYLRF